MGKVLTADAGVSWRMVVTGGMIGTYHCLVAVAVRLPDVAVMTAVPTWLEEMVKTALPSVPVVTPLVLKEPKVVVRLTGWPGTPLPVWSLTVTVN